MTFLVITITTGRCGVADLVGAPAWETRRPLAWATAEDHTRREKAARTEEPRPRAGPRLSAGTTERELWDRPGSVPIDF